MGRYTLRGLAAGGGARTLTDGWAGAGSHVKAAVLQVSRAAAVDTMRLIRAAATAASAPAPGGVGVVISSVVQMSRFRRTGAALGKRRADRRVQWRLRLRESAAA